MSTPKQHRRNFQPRITPKNSEVSSKLPISIMQISSYRTLSELEMIAEEEHFTIFYVLDDSSSKGRLIPLRDSNKRFCTILLTK